MARRARVEQEVCVCAPGETESTVSAAAPPPGAQRWLTSPLAVATSTTSSPAAHSTAAPSADSVMAVTGLQRQKGGHQHVWTTRKGIQQRCAHPSCNGFVLHCASPEAASQLVTAPLRVPTRREPSWMGERSRQFGCGVEHTRDAVVARMCLRTPVATGAFRLLFCKIGGGGGVDGQSSSDGRTGVEGCV